jgi:hypothetical protein
MPMGATHLACCPLEEARLILTLEPGVDVGAADSGIQAIKSNWQFGTCRSYRARHFVPETGRGVHRYRDGDTFGPNDIVIGELIDRQIDGSHVVAGAAQRSRR